MSCIVLHGDCLDLLPTLAASSIDAVITDPEYGTRGGEVIARPGEKSVGRSWDWDTFCTRWLAEAVRLLKPNGSLLVWTFPEREAAIREEYERLGLYHKCHIVWHKTNPVPQFRKRNYLSSWEMCLWAVKDKGDFVLNFRGQNEMHNFIQGPICQGKERTAHPTQKPLYVMRRLIENHTRPGDLILDPFAGSGSTLVACVQTGRRCVGVDCDTAYVEIARRRIAEQRAETPLFEEARE